MPRPEWRFAAASAIGTSHIASGAPCQDYAHCALVGGTQPDVLIGVVCDGAGSAAHSHIGAALAAMTFANLVESHLASGQSVADLTADIARSWVLAVGDALEARAKEEQNSTRDYACTLLAVIAGPQETAFVQVGDGAIVVSHGEDDGWSYVFWPQHGEFANTTNFVVSHNADEVVEFDLASLRIDEFAIFSDGIENLVLHRASRTVHGSFFDKMMKPMRSSNASGKDDQLSRALASYLGSKAICDRTDDDKTLILATRGRRASEEVLA